MSKHENIYAELKKQFSDKEIADRYVLPDDLSEQEKKEIEEKFKEQRLILLKERTEEQRLLSELMRMKLLIKDYLERSGYEEDFSFSKQLGQYLGIIRRNQREFAEEIDLHTTKLSRLLHDRENPNVELVYRLEKHCGNIIPAIYWWKLHSKRLEEDIKTDVKRRKTESEKVKNNLQFRA